MNALRLDGLERLPGVLVRIVQMRRSLEDFRALHQRTGRSVLDWVSRNFEAEGALAQNAAWPPLARSTRESRRRRGRDGKPLQDTGRLRRGITLSVNEQRAVLSDPVPYAARHQLGLGVPRRPFFPGAAQTRKIVFPVVERTLREVLG